MPSRFHFLDLSNVTFSPKRVQKYFSEESTTSVLDSPLAPARKKSFKGKR